jgi:CheY-like chemotaxis protein
MQKARIEAEEARKTQEQFLANMSHEIRTPMNGVIGMTQLLTNTVLNEEQQDYVNTIKESAGNLMVIIDDILDLTKIVAGKIAIEKTDYDVKELIGNIIKLNQFRADEKSVVLNTNIDKNLCPFLYGDPVRLQQILINLVGNALKFTEKGEVNINLQLIKEDAQFVTLEFSVVDTGIGISKENAETVFDRFTQVSGDSKRKYGGTGLGLTITKQLIELQGGTIQVKSKEGVGSTFTFCLPIQKGTKKEKTEIKTISKNIGCKIDHLNILLVEDNFINQKVAIRILTGYGALVDTANNGKEALELFKQKEYDLILMDIQMPEMDGYEATKIIRNEMGKVKAAIPIIAMTASALISDRKKCLVAGMNDYIAKPFQAEALLKKIVQQMENSFVVI